jgi:hypothetical protein
MYASYPGGVDGPSNVAQQATNLVPEMKMTLRAKTVGLSPTD